MLNIYVFVYGITISWTNECISSFYTVQYHLYSMRLRQKRKKEDEKKDLHAISKGKILDEIKFSWYEAYFVEWLFDYWALVLPSNIKDRCLDNGTHGGGVDCFDQIDTLHFMDSIEYFHLLSNIYSMHILICSILMFFFFIILSNFFIGIVDPQKVNNTHFLGWHVFFLN